MNQVEPKNIIAYLNAKITWLGNRIIFWLPIEEQSGIYLTLNILTESQADYSKWTLFEFAFIGHNEEVSFEDLLAFRELVSNELIGNKDLSGFYVYGCSEDGGFINGYDEKNRKVIKQNYRFYFTK